jgi:hypothetical protein
MKNTALFNALWISLSYFVVRGFLFISGWEYAFDFFHRFPIGWFLIMFTLLLFWRTRQSFKRTGELIQAFRDGGRFSLFTAVFVTLFLWIYYAQVDVGYLSGLIQERIEAAQGQISAEDLIRLKGNLEALNSLKIRLLFTLSGLTIYGLLMSLIFSFLHFFRYRRVS